MEGLFGAVREDGDQGGAAADADDGDAGVGVGGQAVHIAEAISDGGALREDQEVLAVTDDLHGGLHGPDVRRAPGHGEGAQFADKPGQGLVVEEGLLRHDAEVIVMGKADADEHRVPVAGVVGAEQDAVAGEVFQALRLEAEDPLDEPPDGPVQELKEHPGSFPGSAPPPPGGLRRNQGGWCPAKRRPPPGGGGRRSGGCRYSPAAECPRGPSHRAPACPGAPAPDSGGGPAPPARR